MKYYFFKNILFNNGWKKDVIIGVNADGEIVEIDESRENLGGKKLITITGHALPGFQNAHSHSFQYAMAGLAEIHELSDTPDDFWSWREAMYSLALKLNPDEFETIATMLYAEMLRHGYTHVAEFHYLHHNHNGKNYDSLSEMGERLISAAKTAGINITLVPIFYQMGGFGSPANEGQKRFISNDIENYLKLWEASRTACSNYSGANIGLGFHSMRGVKPEVIVELSKSGPKNVPYHIHIAEQLKEIEDCQNYLGQRPVEWFLNNVDLNDQWHMVHATHLTESETIGLAKSGANVVLCPSTEGNLGDGIFPLRQFQENNGNWSIGTDSHIGLNPLEELRLLDYGQRLISHKRNTYTSPTEGNSGDYAIDMALKAGRKAMGNFESDYISIGQNLNISVLEKNSPFASTTKNENLTTSLLYTNDSGNQNMTIVNGQIVVENGKHKSYDQILERFQQTIKKIGNR